MTSATVTDDKSAMEYKQKMEEHNRQMTLHDEQFKALKEARDDASLERSKGALVKGFKDTATLWSQAAMPNEPLASAAAEFGSRLDAAKSKEEVQSLAETFSRSNMIKVTNYVTAMTKDPTYVSNMKSGKPVPSVAALTSEAVNRMLATRAAGQNRTGAEQR